MSKGCLGMKGRTVIPETESMRFGEPKDACRVQSSQHAIVGDQILKRKVSLSLICILVSSYTWRQSPYATTNQVRNATKVTLRKYSESVRVRVLPSAIEVPGANRTCIPLEPGVIRYGRNQTPVHMAHTDPCFSYVKMSWKRLECTGRQVVKA